MSVVGGLKTSRADWGNRQGNSTDSLGSFPNEINSLGRRFGSHQPPQVTPILRPAIERCRAVVFGGLTIGILPVFPSVGSSKRLPRDGAFAIDSIESRYRWHDRAAWWRAGRSTPSWGGGVELAMVIERERYAQAAAAPLLMRHRDRFLRQIGQPGAGFVATFEAIAATHQPSGTEAAAAGRAADDLVVFRRRRPGVVPQERCRRGGRRRRRCRNRPSPACRARPSDHAVLARKANT